MPTLRDLRKRRALTQHALAQRVGCTRNYVSMLEAGRVTHIGLGLCNRLAAELGWGNGPKIHELVVRHARDRRQVRDDLRDALVASADSGDAGSVLHAIAAFAREVSEQHPNLAVDVMGDVATALPDVIEAVGAKQKVQG